MRVYRFCSQQIVPHHKSSSKNILKSMKRHYEHKPNQFILETSTRKSRLYQCAASLKPLPIKNTNDENNETQKAKRTHPCSSLNLHPEHPPIFVDNLRQTVIVRAERDADAWSGTVVIVHGAVDSRQAAAVVLLAENGNNVTAPVLIVAGVPWWHNRPAAMRVGRKRGSCIVFARC
jgi:hypothetical protein